MKSKRFRFEVFETDPDRAAKLAADGFVWLCDEDGNIDMSGTKTAGKAKYVPPVLEKDPRKTTHSALLKFAGTNDINLTDDERQLKKADLIALIDKRMTEKATAAGSEGLTRRMSDGTPKEEPKADETE